MTKGHEEIAAGGPLNGITVIDLTRVLAGPYCTMVLADLGARVIKIEKPDDGNGSGDDARHIGPFLRNNMTEKSAYFMPLNRGKESIALDLRNESDKLVFEALLARADIVVENFRPGVMEKLGYGWDDLEKQYPALIYAAASGFGHSGPWKDRAAYDIIAQAMGGMMSVTGHEGGPPTRVGSSIGDITAGLFTAIGINAALVERAKTGRGQKIDVAMLDCQLAILENAIARFLATGTSPGPLGTRHPSITPFAAYQAADGYLVIAAGNNGLFTKLCEVLGIPAAANDERFSTNALRTDNADTLTAIMETALTAKSANEWLELLATAGVPSSPIQNVEQAMTHPQTLARNMVITVEDADLGTVRMAGNPIKLSAHADPTSRKAAPDLDADREKILKELGMLD